MTTRALPSRSAAGPGRLPAIADVLAAAARLAPHVVATPLHRCTRLAGPDGERPWLKLENLQVARCFKPRGAFNAALVAAAATEVTALVTYSSGNHGQAVARAAALLGVPATIVAPTDVLQVKLASMRDLGADVVLHGTTSAERQAEAERLAKGGGRLLLPPYDHLDVIAGQGTVGLEVAAAAPRFDACFVPVGGGGLIAGIAVALAALRPEVRLVGVEPEDADDACRSLAAGRRLANAAPSRSACDGLRNTCLGELNWRLVQRHVAEIVTVTDAEVGQATRELAAEGIGKVEPSGAAAVAALLAGRGTRQGEVAIAIVSGGNAAAA